MIRSVPNITAAAVALVAACCLAMAPAQARKKSAKASEASKSASGKKEHGADKPVEVAKFGDWGAYLAKGKSKTCYALASPKERTPSTKHDAAYVFIADRPAEHVHNEVSIIMGFPVKQSGNAEAKVGSRAFDLITKGSNAWIKNPADEAKFVEALKHAGKLIVKAPAMRGPATTDLYSLAGLRPALERVSKECK